MGQTTELLNAVVEQLKDGFARELSIELFPEDPSKYRLNHPRGAVLVGYGRSRFGPSEALDAVFQARAMVVPLTLVFRQLNGRDGVIEYLDRVRLQLTGWTAPHCDQAMRPLEERFIGQLQGVWQYGLDMATHATQLQDFGPVSGPLLTEIHFQDIEESP